MRNATRAITIATLFVSTVSIANANDLLFQQGFSERIYIPGLVNDVAIGDTSIIDIQPYTQNLYIVNAKAVGTSNLIALNEEGDVIYRARLSVRSIDIWPGYAINVKHGVGLARSFVCAQLTGCPSKATFELTLPPVNNNYYFNSTTHSNTQATTVNTQPSSAQPAPAQPAAQ